MARAAIIGTTVGFTDYYNSVFLEKNDGKAIVIPRATFEDLYYKLDQFTAAMKDDCIEYAINERFVDEDSQPEWYRDAIEYGIIYGNNFLDIDDTNGGNIYHDETGEYDITPGSVILRNHLGQLRYMEWNEFTKYYDVPGSEFID